MGIILVPVSARSSVEATSWDKVYYTGDGVVRIPKEGTVMIVALALVLLILALAGGFAVDPLLFLLALLALVVFLGGERRGTVY